jgi:histidyl-tRNA synthetase
MVRALKGMRDIHGEEAWDFQRIETTVHDVMRAYGYEEIRTPHLEETEVFTRSIGEATDIVAKEMYTFQTRGGESVSLRPEGTASVVRFYVENGLHGQGGTQKLFYLGPMFRTERPQKGRYRQFHQFGIEFFGSPSPLADVEVIRANTDVLSRLNVKGAAVLLNTVGCPACRPSYRERLADYFRPKLGGLCEDCRTRFEKNILRMLDCKVPSCQEVLGAAPAPEESLCDSCRAHQRTVESALSDLGVPWKKNPRLVRGLDYYTKTVFEISSDALGAQDAVAGGGRYDGLVEQMGGPAVPATGSAMGLDRLRMLLPPRGTTGLQGVCLVVLGQKAERKALEVLYELRGLGIRALCEYETKSLKSKMKAADRNRVRWTVLFGEEEYAAGEATLRDMETGDQRRIALDQIVQAVGGQEP